MADEILKELWKIKDDIAKENGYDVKAFVSKLRAKKQEGGQLAIDLRHKKKGMNQGDQASRQ